MSGEERKEDTPEKAEHKKPSNIPGPLTAFVVGVFFLSESYWPIDKGKWPIWSEDKSRVLFSVFYIFGNRIGIYGAAALTGLLGAACIVGAIAAARERPKDDKQD